jgi:hypothetical protein
MDNLHLAIADAKTSANNYYEQATIAFSKIKTIMSIPSWDRNPELVTKFQELFEKRRLYYDLHYKMLDAVDRIRDQLYSEFPPNPDAW